MVVASNDAINSFVHIEGKKISLGDDLQLVARRLTGLRWTYKADKRTWQVTIIHSWVSSSGSLRLKRVSHRKRLCDIKVAFYIFNVCQILGRACALRKMGMSAL